VLEAHTAPGGCAGTFFHQGYRFDSGATLAGGFYPGGPMDMVANIAGVDNWPAHPAEPAMVVHLPDHSSITRFGDDRRWEEYERAFGEKSFAFWKWQEQTADSLWELALRLPAWPPQSPGQLADLANHATRWLASDWHQRARPDLALDAFSPVSRRLKNQSKKLQLFVDAQLLISAQTTSQYANSLYGASALDLPRRGVVHLEGGMEAVANGLVATIRRNGGKVLFRKEATRIIVQGGKPKGVEARRGEYFPADIVVANLPPANIQRLLGKDKPKTELPDSAKGWGAYMLYAGVDESVVPEGMPLHHQIIRGEPLGEGNTVFLSISPEWDSSRAPSGKRAITLSTHTDLSPWWKTFHDDPARYEELKLAYQEKLISAAEEVLPGIRGATRLLMPGTPVTFERFTRRAWGWVGGYPQTSLLRVQKPKLANGIWMVGDSIFPGQSMPAVALGGLRVAGLVLQDSQVGKKIQLDIHQGVQTQRGTLES
jgi:phytoene dehydrogenase-like protein